MAGPVHGRQVGYRQTNTPGLTLGRARGGLGPPPGGMRPAGPRVRQGCFHPVADHASAAPTRGAGDVRIYRNTVPYFSVRRIQA